MIEIFIFETITLTQTLTTESIVFSYNIREYKPRGAIDSIVSYQIGGY